MKHVFHLNVKFDKINSDLYFEDKDTAERIIEFLTMVLSEKVKITGTIEKVHSRETVMEDVIKELNFGKFCGSN